MFERLSLVKAEKILGDVAFEKCFYTHSGKVIHNLHELERMLPQLSPEEFSFHANKEKNDFSAWIEDVMHDEVLSEKILLIFDAKEMASLIRKRILILESHIDSERAKEHQLEENIFSSKEEVIKLSLILLCAILAIVGILLAWNLVKG